MADALEEVAYDHLSAHKREGCYDKVEGSDCLLGQLGASSEDVYHGSGHQFARQTGSKGDASGTGDAVAKHPEDAVVLPRSPVVANDGLHSLNKAHNDGDEQEHDAVDDAVCSDSHVASIL